MAKEEQWGYAGVIAVVAIIAIGAILAVSQQDPNSYFYNSTYVEHKSFDDYYVYNASEPALTAVFIFAHITRLDMSWFNTTDNQTYAESTTHLNDVCVSFEAGFPEYFAVSVYGDSPRPFPMANITLTVYWNTTATFQPHLVSRTATVMGTIPNEGYFIWVWNEYEIPWEEVSHSR